MDLDPAIPGDLGRGARLDAVDDDIVAEPLQLLCDHQRVALAATESEVIRADDDLHRADPRAVSGAPRERAACPEIVRNRRAGRRRRFVAPAETRTAALRDSVVARSRA